MKRFIFPVFFALFLLPFGIQAQVYSLPSADIQNLEGGSFNTSGLSNNGKPMIISFWATWCKPCIMELSNIHDEYEELVEETGVKLVAISIDDMRNVAKVGPFVNGRGWEYEVYCDPNGNFKRALSVNTIPHTFLVDGSGNIVWQHNAYAPGDEDKLFELVRLLAAGKTIPTEK
jgi:cytochrome c biogenesis protein CcmG, thiol:disulfide interchange protein DsbE